MVNERDLGIEQGLKKIGGGIVKASEQGDRERANKYIEELNKAASPDFVLGGATKRAIELVWKHFYPQAQALVDRITNGEDEMLVLKDQLPILVLMVEKLQTRVSKKGDDNSIDVVQDNVLGFGDADLRDVKAIRLEKDGSQVPEKQTYSFYQIEIQKMLDSYHRQDGSFSQKDFNILLSNAKNDLSREILKILLENLGVDVKNK